LFFLEVGAFYTSDFLGLAIQPRRLLEYYAPGFSWEVCTHYNGDRTVIEGRLIIRAAEGNFVREATGTEDNEIDSWGDPSSNAEAMALRRCCAKFGLGLHLWEK
jgi:hypothetical protein